MLIDNSEKISIIKFNSGEEIVCKTHGFTEDKKIIVSYGLTFVMGFNPEKPTQGEVSFSPWLVGAPLDQKNNVNISSTVTITVPSDVVKERYETAIGIATGIKNNSSSGIEGPTKMLKK